MDNTKTLHLNLSMSPRAIDELKQYSNVKYNSKYELPLIMFPDNKTFEITGNGLCPVLSCSSGSLSHWDLFLTAKILYFQEAWSTIIFSVHL